MVHTTERRGLLTSEELLDKTESLINWKADLFNENNSNLKSYFKCIFFYKCIQAYGRKDLNISTPSA